MKPTACELMDRLKKAGWRDQRRRVSSSGRAGCPRPAGRAVQGVRDGAPPPAFVPALTSSSCSLRKHRQAARFLKPSRSYVRVWLGLNFILEPGSCCRCSGRHRGDPAAATPPGSRAEDSRGARAPAGRAAARTRTARPGGRRDAGRNAGHCSPGAAVEAPPLLGRPPLSMEPAAARSHSLPAAAAAAAAAGERARL